VSNRSAIGESFASKDFAFPTPSECACSAGVFAELSSLRPSAGAAVPDSDPAGAGAERQLDGRDSFDTMLPRTLCAYSFASILSSCGVATHKKRSKIQKNYQEHPKRVGKKL